jgi:hypothetical protein
VAVDDEYVGQQDTTLTIDAPGVLANDTDVDGDALYVDSYEATSAFGGSISMNPDGSFSYTPLSGFAGYDSFQYTISDGNGGYDTATVYITVEARNNRSISVDLYDFDLLNRRFISGNLLITNQSDGYDVQIVDMTIEVQYRVKGGGWTYVAVQEGSCTLPIERATGCVNLGVSVRGASQEKRAGCPGCARGPRPASGCGRRACRRCCGCGP